MNRLKKQFDQLAAHSRPALVAYIAAGDAAPMETVPLLHTLTSSGADVIELGIPFSDPIADGPVIQAAYERALACNVNLVSIFDMVRDFRRQDDKTPIVLMGYQNPIEAMGFENFAAQAKDAGVDAVLIVDLPVEEAKGSIEILDKYGIDSIFLLSPTTPEERIAHICKTARGFIYYVSLKGVTGAGHLQISEVAEQLSVIRKHSHLPICVGFGVKDAQTAGSIVHISDGVVVGSALVEIIGMADKSLSDRQEAVAELLLSMRAALDNQNAARH